MSLQSLINCIKNSKKVKILNYIEYGRKIKGTEEKIAGGDKENARKFSGV